MVGCNPVELKDKVKDKVKWFHSGMTDKFCEQEMHALLTSEGIICSVIVGSHTELYEIEKRVVIWN